MDCNSNKTVRLLHPIMVSYISPHIISFGLLLNKPHACIYIIINIVGGNLLKQKNMNDYSINHSEFTKDVDNVNKLSSATSRLFGSTNNAQAATSSNGDIENNYLPDLKDVS